MIKFALVFFILAFLPILVIESSGYIGGDMIENNLLSFNFDKIKKTSDIITINESDNTKNLKRYIVFGYGSTSDLDAITNGISN